MHTKLNVGPAPVTLILPCIHGYSTIGVESTTVWSILSYRDPGQINYVWVVPKNLPHLEEKTILNIIHCNFLGCCPSAFVVAHKGLMKVSGSISVFNHLHV